MKLNQWVMFENDICPDCDHTIFDHAWKNARDSDELIVVVGYTHMQMIELVVQMIAKNQKK